MTKPRTLTETEKTEIRLLKEQGKSTKDLSERFGVHERTVQRIVYGRGERKAEYEKANASARKQNPRKSWDAEFSKPNRPDYSVPKPDRKRAAPKLPALDKIVRKTEVVPYTKGYERQVIQTGAVLIFRKDGTLFRVEGCPIYGRRHVSWIHGTVDVSRIEEGRIFAVFRQWDGEDVTGELVFDGNPKFIKNCYFYADFLPKKVAEREERIRKTLAIGEYPIP